MKPFFNLDTSKDGYAEKELPDLHIKPKKKPPGSVVPNRFYTAPQNCNVIQHPYIISNHEACSPHKDVFLLVIVRTLPSQLDRRMAIRETWGNHSYHNGHVIKVLFSLGAICYEAVQEDIEQENAIYGDIIQQDFKDDYFNLTLKTVFAWKWTLQFCSQAKFVMLANAEIVIDVFKLIPYLKLKEKDTSRDFMLCQLYHRMEVTRPGRFPKWSVSISDYEASSYPDYCMGNAFVTYQSTVRKLYSMSRDTYMFMPDDGWIGVLAEKLGLKFEYTSKAFAGSNGDPNILQYFKSKDYLKSDLTVGVVDFMWPPGNEGQKIRMIWNEILIKHNISKKH